MSASQWVPRSAGPTDSGPQGDAQPKRKYREYPTPHPKKMMEAADYFAACHYDEADESGSSASASRPVTSNYYAQDDGWRERRKDERSAVRGRRTALARRSSTGDSEERTRTVSQMEQGGERRPAHGEHRQSVVAELVQYGLKHGIGGGARRGRTSTSSLYEMAEGAGSGRRLVDKRKRIRGQRRRSQMMHHVEDHILKQKFILRLAKALLSFGAPSHRVESQLHSAANMLAIPVAFVHLPNLVMVTFMDSDTHTSDTHFVRAGGRVALTKLQRVHDVYRDVLCDKIGVLEGCKQLKKIIQEKPLYNIWIRCLLAFFCASIICVLAFGGSLIDMFISGLSASWLQYLGLNAASKSTIYANVYEISVSIIISFLARMLGTLPGNFFCYSAISSAGVVLLLPGFTILISALELTSRNILCGSVRMVYAVIYTLFLGFALTIGSDFYLLVNPKARHQLAATAMLDSERLHGYIIDSNLTTAGLSGLGGTFVFLQTAASGHSNIVKGCYRNPAWPWYRQPFPWWTTLFLVPLYSTCSSIANLQSIRSIQLPIMVTFSCVAYAANRLASVHISSRGTMVSAFGAFVIGLCGNVYSRVVGGTAFTSMVTGVLFLVPSAIGAGGGLIQNYTNSAVRYSGSFELGIRMIKVAIGVTIGLFVAQIMVYAFGRRKNAAHFAF